MKRTKRMAAVLLTLLLVAAMLAVPSMTAGAADPYTPVTAGISTLGLTETLTVTDYPGRTSPAVTYTLTLGQAEDYYDEESVAYPPSNATLTALGDLSNKTLATVSFEEGDAEYDNPATLDYVPNADTLAAINRVQFDRPCIVYLPIIKSITCEDSQLSNNNENDTALVIAVEDSEGTLVPTFGFTTLGVFGPTTPKVTEFNDEYPNVQTLTLTKQVTGNMGQKDRYFHFTVRLTWGEVDSAEGVVLTPEGANSVNSAELKYDEDCEGFNNLALKTVEYTGGQGYTATFEFWLKDGETITIPNLPYGAAYEIWEDEDDAGDYVVTSVVTDEGISGDAYLDSKSEPINGDKDDVVFTNDLNTSPPTGLSLQTAAPIAGVVIALGLGAVLVLSRKRRENGQDA